MMNFRQSQSSTLLFIIFPNFTKIDTFEYLTLDVALHQLIKQTSIYIIAQFDFDDLHCQEGLAVDIATDKNNSKHDVPYTINYTFS